MNLIHAHNLARAIAPNVSLEERGSHTFIAEYMLEHQQDDYQALEEAQAISERLQAAGYATRDGGHVGDHGYGMSLLVIIRLEYPT